MRWLKILVPLAALSLLAALPLAGWASQEQATGPNTSLSRSPDGVVDPPITETAIGDQCTPGTPNDCDDYAVPVDGSCQCTWVVTQIQCQCDNGRRGHLEGTACEICGPCYGPNCHIQYCPTHYSYVCIEGF